MGDSVNAIDADDKRKDRTGSAEQKQDGGSHSAQDTREGGTGGTGGTGGRGTEGITIIEEGASKVADGVTPRIQGKRKRPEAAKGSRSNKAAEKQADAVKEKMTNDAAGMIAALIKTVSDIGSMRAGQHWSLSAKECEAIAKPAASILSRYDLTEKMETYGDWIGLTTALGVAIVPRVLYQVSTNKPKPKEVKNNVQPIRAEQQPQSAITPTSESNRESGQPNGKSSTDGVSTIKQLLTASMGESF